MLKTLFPLSAVLAIFATTACAEQSAPAEPGKAPELVEFEKVDASPVSEGRRLAELAFDSSDQDRKGYLHTGDFETHRTNIFLSMDANENEAIELEEFLFWDFGFNNLADDMDKRSELDTAKTVVFNIWDRDGDGAISKTEHRYAVRADFDRMDINHNSIIERDEFLRGFSIMAAIRAALKPSTK